MREIFQIAGAILASIGGSSVIILGLSSWLGKVWANRILEEEKKKHVLEIESYKSQLNKEINIVNSLIDKSLHVTKHQYDKEFSIYLEIWDKLSSCVIGTLNLYPKFENKPIDEIELEEFNMEKYKNFVVDYNEFSNTILKYSPFYEVKLYDRFIELRNVCSKQGSIFNTYTFEIKYSQTYALVRDEKMTAEEREEVYNENPKLISDLQSELQKEIRDHLKSLQTIES